MTTRPITDLPRVQVTIDTQTEAMTGYGVAVWLNGNEYAVIGKSRKACVEFLAEVGGIPPERQKKATPVAVVQKESINICKKIAKDCKA